MMKKEYKFECLNNDHIFQHNGFINVDKKYLDTFPSKKYEAIILLPIQGVPKESI